MKTRMRHVVIGPTLLAVILNGTCAQVDEYHPAPSATNQTASAAANTIRPAPDWESVFARTDGWTGGDGFGTVALSGGRMLWLFGDSWIGPVRDGKHAPGSAMVNNVIAMQPIAPAGAPPPRECVTFRWGPSGPDGKPSAWIVPPADERARDRNLRYWPAGGGVVVPGQDAGSTLFLFFARVREKGAADSVWNFEGCGAAIARIENPAGAPEAWRVRQTTLTRLPAPIPIGTRIVEWGASAMLASDDSNPHPQADCLVFGVDATDGWNKKLLLARAPAATLDRFDTWSFRTALGWSSQPADASSIADHVMDELSVSRVDTAEGPRFIMIYSKPILDDHIVARIAKQPEGPWSVPRDVYRCPEPSRDERLFAYSAKAHPEVSGTGELLISYCVNSNDFWHMAANAWIYRPRFVRVPLEAVISAAVPTVSGR